MRKKNLQMEIVKELVGSRDWSAFKSTCYMVMRTKVQMPRTQENGRLASCDSPEIPAAETGIACGEAGPGELWLQVRNTAALNKQVREEDSQRQPPACTYRHTHARIHAH